MASCLFRRPGRDRTRPSRRGRVAVAAPDARVLLLAGALDSGPLPRVAAVAELFPEAGPIVQPEAGHVPWLDDPRRFPRTVAAFLDRGR